MTTRELLKRDIDQLQEPYLGFLQRIVRALMPTSSTPSQQSTTADSWESFVQSSYGMFRDDPLERAPQGTLEIREALE